MPFSERRFPGDPRPPGHFGSYSPGPWEDFTSVLPGSELRCRSLYNHRSVLFAGHISAPLPADDEVWLGDLAPAFRPADSPNFRLAINPGLSGEWAQLRIEPGGGVWLRPLTAMTSTAFRLVYPLG